MCQSKSYGRDIWESLLVLPVSLVAVDVDISLAAVCTDKDKASGIRLTCHLRELRVDLIREDLVDIVGL